MLQLLWKRESLSAERLLETGKVFFPFLCSEHQVIRIMFLLLWKNEYIEKQISWVSKAEDRYAPPFIN